MTNSSRPAVLVAAAFLCTASPATGKYHGTSAADCRATSSSTVPPSQMSGGIAYVNTNATTAATVACAIPWSGTGSYTSTDIDVRYRDTNNDNISTASIQCTAAAIEGDGDTWLGATRYSCSTAGGCATNSTPTFSSTNNESLDVEGVAFDDTYAAYVIICNVPDSDTLYSGIVSMYWSF